MARSRSRSQVGGEPEVEPRQDNLPAPLTSFVGREAELAETSRLLESSRLLTLVGAGGIGKTRLALHLARQVADNYAEGVWLVQLAPLTDPAHVAWTVAAALGVSEQPGRPIELSLREQLAGCRALLILDNCEHLVEACAELSGMLLQACTSLAILAASRQALGVEGEAVFSVPGLSLPESPAELDRMDVRHFAAVSLFIDRAQAVAPDFSQNHPNLAIVGEICRRLDGMPLAIELAATRLKLLGAEEVAARLDNRLQLLIGGSRTAPGRHQTLRATLDWSYQLLREQERTLFRRLAVFKGGWTLAAAEDAASGADMPASQIFGLLEQLLDKSLLVIENRTPRQVRFRFLETIRQYAAERLDESGELDSLRRKHLAWCLTLAHDVQPPGMHHPWHAHDSLQEQDNLRAGLLWAIQVGDAEAGLRMAVVLAHLWYLQGHYSEGRARLAELLALQADSIAPEVRASALTWAGYLAYCQGDLKVAQDLLADSLTIWQMLENEERAAVSLHLLASVIRFRGDLRSARPLFEQASVINQRLGHRMREAMNLALVAQVLFEQGDFARAEALNSQSHASLQAAGPGWGTVLTVCMLGRLAAVRGDHLEARRQLEASVGLGRRLGISRGVVWSLYFLAQYALSHGDAQHARETFAESLRLAHQTGDVLATVHCLEGFAGALAVKQPGRTLRLAEAAAALRETVGCAPFPMDQQRLRRWLTVAERRVGSEAAAHARAEARTMSTEQAVVYALAADDARGARTESNSFSERSFAGLTPRGLEVLRLVALAQTNREIAIALVLSEKTVERHLSHIFTKLDVSSRIAAARLAVQAGIA